MNLLTKIIASGISLPARLKGMKFGKNSFIGPGYDFLFVSFEGVVLGDDVMIGKNAWIQTLDNPQVTIGDHTHIGRNFTMSAIKKIAIGQKCLMAYNVSIYDHDHNIDGPKLSLFESGLSKPSPIIIEDECFIGAHSFILKGVHLGKHCVVGANSVVTKSFPAYCVIAGNPAKLIRKLL